MDKHSYIREIRGFLEQFLDNEKVISDNIIQYNCVICGRSKHNEPHMRVVYEHGFYYCYRCNNGSILYNLIKEFKNNNNKEYVNALLRIYFSHFEYDPAEKRNNKKIKDYQSYDFTLDNLTILNMDDPVLSDVQSRFFKQRLPTVSDNGIIDIIKKFKINTNYHPNKIFYSSLHRKFSYSYVIQDDLSYKKEKHRNSKINNDKKDYYYLINKINAKNLYISEGLFDLVTYSILDPLYNIDDANFLAFCCRTYSFLYEVLLNSGKFFYDNIYLILDNDIREREFIKGTISNLSNNKSNRKYRLFKNFYTIKAPSQYVDLNQYYVNNEISNVKLLINKII